MADRTVSLKLMSDIDQIDGVSAALEGAMRDHGFGDEDILDTQLAVEEAVTNIILHGYEKTPGEISVQIRATRGMVEIQLEDTAPPFDPLSLPEPDIAGEIEDRKIGGLGIFLIRQVMDDIVYRYEDGKNVLVLVKRRAA